MYSLTAMIASRYGQLDFRTVLATPLRPLAAGIVMLAVVTTLRTYLPIDSSAIVSAVVLVAAGAVTYGAVMFLAFRPLVLEILSLVYRRRGAVA